MQHQNPMQMLRHRQAPHDLNRELVSRLQASGEAFISKAIITLSCCTLSLRGRL